jgi:hypothetical protein
VLGQSLKLADSRAPLAGERLRSSSNSAYWALPLPLSCSIRKKSALSTRQAPGLLPPGW